MAYAAQGEDAPVQATAPNAGDTDAFTSKPNSPLQKNSRIKSTVKEGFEKLLKLELPATYKFYAKLPSKDQNKVIKIYSQEKKISAASKLIFDLYFKNH